LTLFYNFIVSSSNICRWSLTISPPINFLTINISNRTIQHNTLFNFFPFPNLTIYMVRFKTKVSHITVTEEDWTMRLCMTVFLGNNNVYDVENHELPRLVYFLVRPGFDHHKKAGAMNSLVILGISIVPYRLKVDCYHYIYNSKTLRGAMCSVVASQSRKKICYVHYPQRFDGIGIHDIYIHNTSITAFLLLSHNLSLSNLNCIPTLALLHWKQKEQSHRCWSFARATEENTFLQYFLEELENEESEFRNSDLQLGLATLEKKLQPLKELWSPDLKDTSENQICWDPWHQMQRILLEYWLKFTGNKMGWDRWQ
ncbi:hypothetical protein HID58_034980, partial [Brassica napus]